tara:strand:+ start:66 stop:596 length:531 start_codon:yes stop_codon:yes gene_type:complete
MKVHYKTPEVFDSIFSVKKINELFKEVQSLPFTYGEQDNRDTPPTGMISDIYVDGIPPKNPYLLHVLTEFYRTTEYAEIFPCLSRAYVNMFSPGEVPYYHTDGACMTMIYYANSVWDWDEGGETKIINYGDNTVDSIPPIPGRVLIFDGRHRHTATSFRSSHRFTVALKYKRNTLK